MVIQTPFLLILALSMYGVTERFVLLLKNLLDFCNPSGASVIQIQVIVDNLALDVRTLLITLLFNLIEVEFPLLIQPVFICLEFLDLLAVFFEHKLGISEQLKFTPVALVLLAILNGACRDAKWVVKTHGCDARVCGVVILHRVGAN